MPSARPVPAVAELESLADMGALDTAFPRVRIGASFDEVIAAMGAPMRESTPGPVSPRFVRRMRRATGYIIEFDSPVLHLHYAENEYDYSFHLVFVEDTWRVAERGRCLNLWGMA